MRRFKTSVCSGHFTYEARLLGFPQLLLRADFWNQGLDLYKAGRYSDAVDAFDQAVKRKDKASEAQGVYRPDSARNGQTHPQQGALQKKCQ